ncbi:MAG: Fic family protein [Candidatus Aenigmarchaeota archaeon]|nr:Fic family protein [Candidatus Aenigmarchaeota archaeon]
MNIDEFKGAFGTLEEIDSKEWGKYLAFIPCKLPPKIEFKPKLVLALSDADSTLSKLSGAGLLLPNPDLLVAPYMRKEALSSSRIEGTRISLSDYFLAEARGDEDKDPDASEVINYIRAMNYALEEIKTKNIDIQLIEKMHEILMSQVRGQDKLSGSYRPIQNWIGVPNSQPQNAVFVPPPPEKVKELMQDMINYIGTNDEMPLLLKAALLHYQFETIHPFCDGNGRIGRALIVLYLCKKKKISKPLLYISGFFEKHKQEYTGLLAQVNKKGDFEEWLLFFLEAIKTQSEDALEKAIKLQRLKESYREKIQMESHSNNILQVVDYIFINPFIQITKVSKHISATYPTAKRIVDELMKIGILRQVNGTERNKTFVAHEVLDIISL